MTQFPHDQFVKDYLPELLGDYGETKAAVEMATQVREIDVLFIPNAPVPENILGVLAQLAQKPSLFEVFRNHVTPEQIRSCIAKLFEFQRSILNQGQRNNRPFSERELPQLWVLTPTLSQNILESFGATKPEPQWAKGLYLLPESLHTGIVVIHQLPSNPETLWLRILGKGPVQEKAIKELQSLPTGHPYKENVLELVYKLLSILEVNKRSGQKVEPEDERLIMRINTLYLEKLQEATQQGIQQGVQQGIQQGIQQGEVKLIIRQLKRRFGELPTELETAIANLDLATIENLAEALLDFDSLEDLTQWLNPPQP